MLLQTESSDNCVPPNFGNPNKAANGIVHSNPKTFSPPGFHSCPYCTLPCVQTTSTSQSPQHHPPTSSTLSTLHSLSTPLSHKSTSPPLPPPKNNVTPFSILPIIMNYPSIPHSTYPSHRKHPIKQHTSFRIPSLFSPPGRHHRQFSFSPPHARFPRPAPISISAPKKERETKKKEKLESLPPSLETRPTPKTQTQTQTQT